jgi:hypothetical protein
MKKKTEVPKVQSLFDFEDHKIDLSDSAYCERFAWPEDWASLRHAIEERRKQTPAFAWWACACGWGFKIRGDTREYSCHRCHQPARRLSEAEAAERDQAELEARKSASERAFRAALFNTNQRRQSEGLPVYTESEFRAVYAQEWEQRVSPEKAFRR